jgi:hypothetical protein
MRESILRLVLSMLQSAKGHLQDLGMNDTVPLVSDAISHVENELILMTEPAVPIEEENNE